MKFMNDRWLYSQLRDEAGEGDEGSQGGEGEAGEGEGSTGEGSEGDQGQGEGDQGTGDQGTGEEGGEGASYFQSAPEDWRVQLANGDEARLNDLSRYTDLGKFIDSAFEAKGKLRKGEISTGLPDEPSDEQLAAYREANGIPVEADGYKMELQDGLELSEMDQEVMGNVYKIAHEHNISNDALSAITNMHLQAREVQLQALENQDGLDKMETEKIMRENWKGDYDSHMASVVSMLNRLPEEVRDEVVMGRTASGKGLMNTPEFVQMLADIALEVNPMANIPGGSDNMTATADAIISKVKTIFAEGREAEDYYKDSALQKQYEQALAAKAKSKS